MSTDVSEEHIASIFRVEKYAEEETRAKAGGKQSGAWNVCTNMFKIKSTIFWD
jgi:hypothetical protein